MDRKEQTDLIREAYDRLESKVPGELLDKLTAAVDAEEGEHRHGRENASLSHELAVELHVVKIIFEYIVKEREEPQTKYAFHLKYSIFLGWALYVTQNEWNTLGFYPVYVKDWLNNVDYAELMMP